MYNHCLPKGEKSLKTFGSVTKGLEKLILNNNAASLFNHCIYQYIFLPV